MTGPSSPTEPRFKRKLQALITSLQAIEASLDEGTGPSDGRGDASLSPDARQALEDAGEKLGAIAHAIEEEFTGQDEATAGVKPASQAALEQEIARWASFPELNANPILELSLQGQVLYTNPTAQRLFPDLKSLGLRHPYLSGWDEDVQALCQGLNSSISREVQVDKKSYQSCSFPTCSTIM